MRFHYRDSELNKEFAVGIDHSCGLFIQCFDAKGDVDVDLSEFFPTNQRLTIDTLQAAIEKGIISKEVVNELSEYFLHYEVFVEKINLATVEKSEKVKKYVNALHRHNKGYKFNGIVDYLEFMKEFAVHDIKFRYVSWFNTLKPFQPLVTVQNI